MKIRDIKHWATERISQTILYAMVGVSILVFILFWTMGYNRPYIDDPNFNDPLLTSTLIVLMWIMLITALATTVWSIASTLKKRGKAQRIENGIPIKKISYGVIIGTLALLTLTLVFASTKPMHINGTVYSDTFWLRISDMFVNTSIAMIIMAGAAVIFCGWRNRKLHRKEGKDDFATQA